MNDKELIETLRTRLVPQGEMDVVRLHLENEWFNHSVIQECIREIERMPMMVGALGHVPTALERLAYHLLCDSAYIDEENQNQNVLGEM